MPGSPQEPNPSSSFNEWLVEEQTIEPTEATIEPTEAQGAPAAAAEQEPSTTSAWAPPGEDSGEAATAGDSEWTPPGEAAAPEPAWGSDPYDWSPPDETGTGSATGVIAPVTAPVSDAQRRAVAAYTGQLLEPELATATAGDVIAGYGQGIGARQSEGITAEQQNEFLLSLTRLMTAVSLPDRSTPDDRREAILASIGERSHCTCREAGALLAARANGNIEARQQEALVAHLAECEYCRKLAEDMVVAEDRFRAELAPPARGALLQTRNVLLMSSGLLALLVAGGIVLATSGGSNSPTLAARHNTPPITTPALATHTATTAATPKRKRKTAAHHHRAAARKPATHHVATKPAVTASAPTYTPPTYTPPTYTPPASTYTPPASSSSSAATSSSSAGAAVSSSSSSSSLGAASAPQSGIGNVGGG